MQASAAWSAPALESVGRGSSQRDGTTLSLRYWVVSAGVMGAAAGVPWAWALAGLLPAVVFGVLAAAQALVQWTLLSRAAMRSDQARLPWTWWVASTVWGIACGALVAYWLGDFDSYTWLDHHTAHCFRLRAPPPDTLPQDPRDFFALPGTHWERAILLFVACPLGVATFTTASLVGGLRARWLFDRYRFEAGGHRAWFRIATACAVASALWSIANEAPAWPAQRPGRDICNPEVGWIALVGYLVAWWGYRKAQRQHDASSPSDAIARSSATNSFARAATRRLRWAIIIAGALSVIQALRTSYVIGDKLIGHFDCRCEKRLSSSTSIQPLDALPRIGR